MTKHITSQLTTPEDRNCITLFLSREFIVNEYGHKIENAVWKGEETGQDFAIESDLAFISNIIDDSVILKHYGYFKDADLIEVLFWPTNFLNINTLVRLKQFPDGTLKRLQSAKRLIRPAS